MKEFKTKKCKDCEISFPATTDYFYKNKSNAIDGLNPYCKSCTSKRSLKWQYENPDKKKINNNRHDDKPQRHVAKKIASQKKRDSGDYKKWQNDNPDKVKKYNEKHRNHKITKKEWIRCKIYFNYECCYCGISEESHKLKYKQQLHKDHAQHDGENDISNCLPACRACNSSKHIFSIQVWYNESNSVFSKDRLDKIEKWLNQDYKNIPMI